MATTTSHNPVQNVCIDDSHSGQRIDNYLISVLKGVPKSLIYRLLRSGQVRVNSGRKKPNYRLINGDSVRIPPIRLSEKEQVSIPPYLIAQIENRIVFENDDLLIINKPSGLAVHAGSGLAYGIIDIIRQSRGEGASLELVHRLDRETSGCLAITKNRDTLLKLHSKFRHHETDGAIKKLYQTLVMGEWSNKVREVSAPLTKNTLRSGERISRVDEAGKPAVSRFQPLELYNGASLLEVTLLTGRTHQIRAHAAHIGHPVAGDRRYGDTEFNRRLKNLGLKRLFLHATRLRFHLGTWIDVSAPIDDELQSVLLQLEHRT